MRQTKMSDKALQSKRMFFSKCQCIKYCLTKCGKMTKCQCMKCCLTKCRIMTKCQCMKCCIKNMQQNAMIKQNITETQMLPFNNLQIKHFWTKLCQTDYFLINHSFTYLMRASLNGSIIWYRCSTKLEIIWINVFKVPKQLLERKELQCFEMRVDILHFYSIS